MILGITGGVGCGKSTVLHLLASRYGAKIIVADEIGHVVMEPGTGAWQEIRETFGPEVIRPDGTIDRAELAGIIYQDDEKRQMLNSIIHPRVFLEIQHMLREWREEPLVVIETAILFETGCDRLCHRIWWIDTERETRILRLMESRGYSREKAEDIMRSQMSEDEWRIRCHHRIDNNGNIENLLSQMKELLYIT